MNEISFIMRTDDAKSALKRDASGQYMQIAIINDTYGSSYFPKTDGEWIAVVNGSATNLYKLENDVPVFKQPLDFYYSDNTFAFFPGGFMVALGKDKLLLYKLDTEWTLVANVPIGSHYITSNDFDIVQNGKHVVTSNSTHIDIFELNAAGPSIDRIASFMFNASVFAYSGVYNGVDTVAIGTSSAIDPNLDNNGGVQFYQKVNGDWISGQLFTADDLGTTPSSYAGYGLLFVDENTLAVAAPSDGSMSLGPNTPGPAGSVQVMGRDQSGVWQQKLRLTVDDKLYLGFDVSINKYNELLVPGFAVDSLYDGYVYSISTCISDPINVTCNVVTANDCSDLSLDSLFTLNNPLCGAVKSSVGGVSYKDNKITVEYSFSKLSLTASCNATVTCPIINTPTVTSVPVASTPKSKTGGSATLGFSLIAIMTIFLMVLA